MPFYLCPAHTGLVEEPTPSFLSKIPAIAERLATLALIALVNLATLGSLILLVQALLAASDALLPPYLAVQVMIEGDDPARAVLVVVHTTPLFMVYRLARTPGAPPPDAPLIDVDQ